MLFWDYLFGLLPLRRSPSFDLAYIRTSILRDFHVPWHWAFFNRHEWRFIPTDLLEQLHPNFTRFAWDSIGGILTKSGCPLLIRSPVFDAFCTSPNCSLCPSLHTDCETVINPSRVSAGECDSMLRTSGSVEPLMISRAFARRPDVQLSSGFQVRTQRVSIARSGQHARAWTPGCLALEQGLPLNFACSSGTHVSLQVTSGSSLLPCAVGFVATRRDCEELLSSVIHHRPPFFNHSCWFLRQRNIDSNLIILCI